MCETDEVRASDKTAMHETFNSCLIEHVSNVCWEFQDARSSQHLLLTSPLPCLPPLRRTAMRSALRMMRPPRRTPASTRPAWKARHASRRLAVLAWSVGSWAGHCWPSPAVAQGRLGSPEWANEHCAVPSSGVHPAILPVLTRGSGTCCFLLAQPDGQAACVTPPPDACPGVECGDNQACVTQMVSFLQRLWGIVSYVA
jgi:hypothetical protein